MSQYQLARAVDVPARRINEIVHGQRRISASDTLTTDAGEQRLMR